LAGPEPAAAVVLVLLVVLLVAQELADVRAFGGEEPWAG
jgi:hypothetical protein